MRIFCTFFVIFCFRYFYSFIQFFRTIFSLPYTALYFLSMQKRHIKLLFPAWVKLLQHRFSHMNFDFKEPFYPQNCRDFWHFSVGQKSLNPWYLLVFSWLDNIITHSPESRIAAVTPFPVIFFWCASSAWSCFLIRSILSASRYQNMQLFSKGYRNLPVSPLKTLVFSNPC